MPRKKTMNTTKQEDIIMLDQKLKKICSECEKLINGVDLIQKQAKKCVEELNVLRKPKVWKVKLYKASNKLDLLCELILKLNCELEISNIGTLIQADKLSIPYISINTSTSSLKYLTGDSPWNFWLQESSSDIKVLHKLLFEKVENGKLQKCSSLPAVGDSVCYAERRRVFRGVVSQHIGNNRLKVIDVDTSCVKVVSLDKVYEVDEDVCELNAQAIKCCLSDDFDNCFMWSSDLGSMFINNLNVRNGNLHVKICKQLPGSPPVFIVDVKVENEDEEGDLYVNEWICERVLPELKEVYVEGVETLCDFLSPKALDPYFQDSLLNFDNAQTQLILQELVETKLPSNVESRIDCATVSPNSYSSSKNLNLSESMTAETNQLKSYVPNVILHKHRGSCTKPSVNSKISKTANVAEMLERSVAAASLEVQNTFLTPHDQKLVKNSSRADCDKKTEDAGNRDQNESSEKDNNLVFHISLEEINKTKNGSRVTNCFIENKSSYQGKSSSNVPVAYFNNLPQAFPSPVQRLSPYPLPFGNHSLVLPPFNRSQIGNIQFHQYLQSCQSLPSSLPGLWTMHQPNFQFYPQFQNRVQVPQQCTNMNLLQGPNSRYNNVPLLTATKTMPYQQWSTGVNEVSVSPYTKNIEKSSETKVTISKKSYTKFNSRRESDSAVNQELTTNNVRNPLSDLPRNVGSEDYFVDNPDPDSDYFVDTDVEKHYVKLKHPRTLLKPNENMLIMMAHVESPGEFYVHVVVKHNLFIDKLKDDMLKHYRSSKLNVKQSWEDAKNKYGTYCACNWPEDGKWYRVEVIDWNIDGNVLVYFVDYGNRDEVPLSTIQPLAKQFTRQAMMAQPCHLANIYPADSAYNIWSDEAISFFTLMFLDEEAYKAVVVPSSCNQFSNSLAVKLFVPDKDNEMVSVNDLMVREGYAVLKGNLSSQNSNSIEDPEIGGSIGLGTDKDWDKWNPLEEDYQNSANCFNIDHENAKFAVTGYQGKDESNICRFFAKSGKCWKKYCTKEHVLSNPDYVPDKIYERAFEDLKLPNPGDLVVVKIMCICSVNRFFAQLQHSVPDQKYDEMEETLESLSLYMNKRSNILEMKPLDVPPVVGQLVIAKSSDGYWFRARVLANDCDIEVKFVDYGTEEFVFEQELRQIEPRYLHLPFQAVECILANVCPIEDESKNKKTVELLKKHFSGKTLYAKINASSDALCRLEVFLKDKGSLDVGDWLIRQHLCKRLSPTKLKFKGPVYTVE